MACIPPTADPSRKLPFLDVYTHTHYKKIASYLGASSHHYEAPIVAITVTSCLADNEIERVEGDQKREAKPSLRTITFSRGHTLDTCRYSQRGRMIKRIATPIECVPSLKSMMRTNICPIPSQVTFSIPIYCSVERERTGKERNGSPNRFCGQHVSTMHSRCVLTPDRVRYVM